MWCLGNPQQSKESQNKHCVWDSPIKKAGGIQILVGGVYSDGTESHIEEWHSEICNQVNR